VYGASPTRINFSLTETLQGRRSARNLGGPGPVPPSSFPAPPLPPFPSPSPSLPFPFPFPLTTGVRGYNPGKIFEIADARRRVLAHFGYKIQHFDALGFVLVFRLISRHNIISNIIALCCSKFHQILKYIGLYYVMYPSTLHH
jgi:hypothetical protein